MIRLARISGDSMFPTYCDGNIVLVREIKTHNRLSVRVGDIVLFRHPVLSIRLANPYACICKRIHKIRRMFGGFHITVYGDNHDNSLDSRYIGDIPYTAIKAVVVFPKRLKEINHED
jgi:signal peptidase I